MSEPYYSCPATYWEELSKDTGRYWSCGWGMGHSDSHRATDPVTGDMVAWEQSKQEAARIARAKAILLGAR